MRINQRINFYSDDFKPPVIVLSALQMAQYTVAMLVLLLIISGVIYYPIISADAKLESLNQALAAKKNELAEAKRKYPKILKNQALAEQLNSLRMENANKLKLLDYLQSDSLKEAQNFSKVLNDLSDFDHQNVWLTRVDLLNEGRSIRLSGLVSKADVLPGYIDGLKKADSFNGRAFNIFDLESDAENSSYLHFVLSTERARGKDEG